MEYLTANNVMFCILAMIVLVCGFLSVTSTKILRAATFLFITLIGIAGLYLQMNYEFIAAVQLSVYAGGIMVLIVFAILLIKNLGTDTEKVSRTKMCLCGLAVLFGAAVVLITMSQLEFVANETAAEISEQVDMQLVGQTLMGTDKYQYLLAFEAVSVLLLACIIGSLVVANKSKDK